MDSKRRENSQIRFLTRPGCGLCAKARPVLEGIARRWGLEIADVDISGEPDLEREFGWDIPIAFLGETELFRHYAAERPIEEQLRKVLEGEQP